MKRLQGKKRNILIVVGLLLEGTRIIFPHLIPQDIGDWADGVIKVLLGYGMYDSVRRSSKLKNK